MLNVSLTSAQSSPEKKSTDEVLGRFSTYKSVCKRATKKTHLLSIVLGQSNFPPRMPVKDTKGLLYGTGISRESWKMFTRMSRWKLGSMVSKWVITQIHPPSIRRWNNPLILTIDPNFQRDIQVGCHPAGFFRRNPTSNVWGFPDPRSKGLETISSQQHLTTLQQFFSTPTGMTPNILLMDKILHHQGWWLSHYL